MTRFLNLYCDPCRFPEHSNHVPSSLFFVKGPKMYNICPFFKINKFKVNQFIWRTHQLYMDNFLKYRKKNLRCRETGKQIASSIYIARLATVIRNIILHACKCKEKTDYLCYISLPHHMQLRI